MPVPGPVRPLATLHDEVLGKQFGKYEVVNERQQHSPRSTFFPAVRWQCSGLVVLLDCVRMFVGLQFSGTVKVHWLRGPFSAAQSLRSHLGYLQRHDCNDIVVVKPFLETLA